MSEPTHIKDIMEGILIGLEQQMGKTKVLECIGCGKAVPDTKDQNIYHGIEGMINDGDAICHDCLSSCMRLCMDRPMIIRQRQGMPIAERLACIPFSDRGWLVLT